MTFSEILNILLGGGLLALVVGVITLKATVRKANAQRPTPRVCASPTLKTPPGFLSTTL